MMTAATAFALMAWLAVLLAPFQAYRTRERLEPDHGPRDLSDVTVLIPARNEAAVIDRTLSALLDQGPGLDVVVIDDQSEDDTAGRALRFGPTVTVMAGEALPEGWAGKLWALEQGLGRVTRRRVLLLDADIELAPGMIAALLRKADTAGATLVSVMAKLRAHNPWERLLVPPFVFFFKLLYPFALVNRRASRVAAAAGGCMLVETAALRDLGGFGPMRGALIDDCTLARLLKHRGHGVWLGLSASASSLRGYDCLADFWRMVARSAFTQLRYSFWLLLATIAVMLALFAAPVAALGTAPSFTAALGLAALAAMAAAYAPMTRFYGLPLWWTLTLPVAALMFAGMTISSAISYWRGTRATWKNRSYEVV
jgi:hopene-associated glycosyltransferase HpnB